MRSSGNKATKPGKKGGIRARLKKEKINKLYTPFFPASRLFTKIISTTVFICLHSTVYIHPRAKEYLAIDCFRQMLDKLE